MPPQMTYSPGPGPELLPATAKRVAVPKPKAAAVLACEDEILAPVMLPMGYWPGPGAIRPADDFSCSGEM